MSSKKQQRQTVRNSKSSPIWPIMFMTYLIPKAIKFLHAVAGFPVKETWMKAIKNRHYGKALSRHHGYTKGSHEKAKTEVRSTKVKITDEATTITPSTKKYDVYIKIFNARDTIHMDQIGNFLVTSSHGNKVIIVLVNVDGNYVDAEPAKDHTDVLLIKAYTALWNILTASKMVSPKLHMLDNEASAAFKVAIKTNCDLQLVPPDMHRCNLAEWAIQTFNHHFIAI